MSAAPEMSDPACTFAHKAVPQYSVGVARIARFFAAGRNGIRGIRRGNGRKKIGIREMRNSDAQL